MSFRDEMRAYLYLLRATEPPAHTTHQYVAAHGPVETVAHIRNGTAPAAVLMEIHRPDARIDYDLRALDNGTARLLTPDSDEWPTAQLTSHGAPLALWVRGQGSLAELTGSAVTITGARVCSNYGNTVAADMSYDLARAGVTVVSGGGFGVDEAAHRGALAADGKTVIVLANGVDRTHPHQHARLYQAVLEHGGLLVSEYPIGTPPTRVRFRARCRLLAALSASTVIVEAGHRSGALAVAQAVNDLGRRVYGIPGPIYSTTSKGVNELIRTGAAEVAGSAEHINYQQQS